MTTTYPPYPVPGPAPGQAHEPDRAPLPYHRLALVSGTHRWWRPLAGAALLLCGTLAATLAVLAAADIAGSALHRPQDADGFSEFGGIGDTAIALLSLALLTPVVLLTVRWAGRRPAGTVSSVSGRLRRRWLGRCLALALPVAGATLGISLLLPDEDGGAGGAGDALQWTGWLPFLAGLAVVCALVPFQAAAEEYVFRGWLLQAVGAWCRSPWVAVVPQALLFAAAHGWGTPWGFVDLLVFGVVAAVLTVRTGGLEAAIALHVLNNLLSMGFAAGVVGALASEETAADMTWTMVAVDAPLVCLYGAAVLWTARRRGPATVAAGRVDSLGAVAR
ncbi:lysostaphin resistance A-like protein [Streptomyces sp. NPDC050658]|uniref:CPBP family intramembrane glutamic endopeptidase n=1 Tax=unclassified Streptomyces TaxID=2593676 RepID=UPI003435A915